MTEKNILVVGAHPDDELLGLGGTLARHVAEGNTVTIALVADTNAVRYETETAAMVRACAREAALRLGITDLRFAGMADQKLDTLSILEVTQWIEQVMMDVRPSIIYTHHRGDINRDHQVVHEATLTAARPYSAPFVERLLSFETPSATEWADATPSNYFVPNVFIDISAHLDAKLHAMATYSTELRPYPHPRSLQALRNRAAHWGSVIGVDAAEPFMMVREVQR